MDTYALLAYIVAAICFALAAVNVPARVSLVALGLLAWVSVSMVLAIRAY
jgi:hypothetical protein